MINNYAKLLRRVKLQQMHWLGHVIRRKVFDTAASGGTRRSDRKKYTLQIPNF